MISSTLGGSWRPSHSIERVAGAGIDFGARKSRISLENEKKISGFLLRYKLIIVILNIIYKALATTLVKSVIKELFSQRASKVQEGKFTASLNQSRSVMMLRKHGRGGYYFINAPIHGTRF
jgi:hypothetical protein